MAYSQPLDPNERQIRLLTPSSSISKGVLQCAIHTFFVGSTPTYTALSYVWGDETITSTININDMTISITTNLEIALRNLWQKEGPEVSVWADAICINQADNAEKESQVRMMGEIYSNGKSLLDYGSGRDIADLSLAAEVWIWLGESADSSDLALQLVQQVTNLDFEDPNLVLDPVAWNAFWSLMRRPWWKRIWVVQEAFFGQKAIVNCGQTSVRIECFIHLQSIKTKYRRRLEPRLRPIQCVPAAPFFAFLSDWEQLKASFAMYGGIPLSRLLSLTGGFKSTLERDKIFALLGMSTALDRRVIQVDYKSTGEFADVQLNITIAAYFLTRDHQHNCLHHLQINQESKSLGLPSWVPDYTMEDEIGHFMFPNTEHSLSYSAGADNFAWAAVTCTTLAPEINSELNSVMPRFETDALGVALILPGLFVDSISISHQTPTVPFYQDRDLEKTGGFDLDEDDYMKRLRRKLTIDVCKIWEQLALELFKDESDPYKSSPGGRYEAFWRTLIADRESNWDGPPSQARDFGGRFEAWKRGSQDEAYVRPYSDAAILRCMSRSFFITRKGYLGLGPSKTMAGDVVCLLRGGNVPFVLRRRRKESYSLVGEAYVHGIMDGTFVREARQDVLEEFWIR